jgi:hypothetical protein
VLEHSDSSFSHRIFLEIIFTDPLEAEIVAILVVELDKVGTGKKKQRYMHVPLLEDAYLGKLKTAKGPQETAVPDDAEKSKHKGFVYVIMNNSSGNMGGESDASLVGFFFRKRASHEGSFWCG